MTKMTTFEEVPEFTNDIKKLGKKYHHFDGDFERFKIILQTCLPEHPRGTFRIAGLGHTVKTPIYKVKDFRSIDFKGKGSRSGFRIIYAYLQEKDHVIFIEAYHKNKQENEDKNRIYKYFKIIEESTK